MKKPDADEQSTRSVRKRNPDESKRRILDAAERAFARRGFDGARLRDIAYEAGVHHALVHHYYGDKRGLFKEVVQRALAYVSSAGLERLAGQRSLDATVAELVAILYDFFSNHEDLLRIVESAFRDRESAAYELVSASFGELVAPLLRSIRERILLAQEHRLIRSDLTPDAMILFSFSAIVYPFVTADRFMTSLGVASETIEDVEGRKRQLVAYVISALRAPS